MQHLARTYVELETMKMGEGTLPEPFHEGHHRLTLPLGVIRKNGWTAGLSAMKALNREIAPQSDYALDRQSLVCLSHATAGVILEGVKAKHNPNWSTVRNGDDAYPTQTGELNIQEATTFPASSFALKAQLNNEISLGGISPSKFTEHNFPSAVMPRRGVVHSAIRIEAKTGRA